MKNFIPSITHLFNSECDKYQISYTVAAVILFSPLLIVLCYGMFMLLPFTRKAALLLVQENYPVEILTFFLLFLGSLLGLHLAWLAKNTKDEFIIWSFYLLFSFGLFLVAMEEIAWGQQFLGFQTPEFIKSVNRQGELTLHNIKGLQGHSEYFRVLFGVGGLVGISLNFHTRFIKLGVPLILFPCFLTITAVSIVDLFCDFVSLGEQIDWGLRWMSEVIEMIIGGAGYSYIWLMTRWYKLQ